MPDNTTLNAMTGGDVISTELIAGVKVPRSKIVLGASGVDSGDVSTANRLPVTIGEQDILRDYVNAGSNIYSNVAGDFTATANVGAKTITLSSYANTILSSTITVKNFAVSLIKRVSSTGVVDNLPTTNIAFSANVLTLSDMAANFASGDSVTVVLFGPDKSYDESNDLEKVSLGSGIIETADSIKSSLATDVIIGASGTQLTPKFAAVAAASSGNNTIVAAVTSKKIRVLAAKLSFSGTVNAKWQSGAGGTDLTGLTYGVANVVDSYAFNPLGHFETASGVLLNLNLSGAVAVGGYVVYVEV